MQKSVLFRPAPGVAYLRPTPCNFLPGLWQQCLRLSFCSLHFIPVLQPKYCSCKNQILSRRKSFSKLTHWSGSHSSALFLPAPPFLHVPLNTVYSLLTRPSVIHIMLLLVNCVEFFYSYYGGRNHTQGLMPAVQALYPLAVTSLYSSSFTSLPKTVMCDTSHCVQLALL